MNGNGYIWLAETISSIAEAHLIKELTAETGKPTWISFTVKDETNHRSLLRSGESVYDAVCQIAGQHVSAILFNCSGAEFMEAALISAKQALMDNGIENEVLLGVYANCFPPIDDHYQANKADNAAPLREDLSPNKYREFASSWVKAGASIIGGCCGVSPEHIKQLAEGKKQLIG